MKGLNNIIYFLFALIVLGSFANFAQNAYGYVMINVAELFVAFILWTQGIIQLTRMSQQGVGKSFYLFFESFFIGAIFMGAFFKFLHWPGAGLLYVFPVFFLVISYLIYSLMLVLRHFKKGPGLALAVFFFMLTALAAASAYVFKVMHWPGSLIIGFVSAGASIIFLLLWLIKRKYNYEGSQVTLRSSIMAINGRPGLVFGYFSAWIIYINLIILGVAPDFYTYAMSRPPAVEELKQKGQDEKAAQYMENYEAFFEKRNN